MTTIEGPPRFAVLVVVLMLVGCAFRLPLSDQDRCGLQWMELRGANLSTARSSGTHRRGGVFDGDTATSSSETNGREVRCEVPPEDNERRCRVNAFRSRALYKNRHDTLTRGGLRELAKKASDEWQRAYRACMPDAGDDDAAEEQEGQ